MNTICVEGGDYATTRQLSGEYLGVKVQYRPSELRQVFRKVLAAGAFQAAEFSLANAVMLLARGAADFLCCPVFANRAFRHRAVKVLPSSSLVHPEQLRGRRIGVREYSQTAAVWARGLLASEYGVDWRDVDWYVGRTQRFPAPERDNIHIVDEAPEALLATGAVDAIIVPTVRPYQGRELQTRPLLPDVTVEEGSYYRRTGIYPINHVVILHRTASVEVPDAAEAVFRAYSQGRSNAMRSGVWPPAQPGIPSMDECIREAERDTSPIGLTESNCRNVRRLIEYLRDQELIEDLPAMERLFVPRAGEWTE